MPGRHIVVVGLMGSGKTTIGSALAERLGWPFRDSDVELRAAGARTAREIVEAGGVARLHALEAELLLGALVEPGPSVIAAAASTIEEPRCRAALSAPDIAVVWLRGDPATLAARVRVGDHRPVLGPDQRALLQAQAARRDPLFESVEPIVVDIDDASPRQLRDRVLQRLGVLPAPRGATGA